VEKILSSLPSSVASVELQFISACADGCFELCTALHHVKRKLSGCRGSGEPGDENYRNRSNESGIDVSSESWEATPNGSLQAAYDLMFFFTGMLWT
jgi:hypothetical protein